MCNWAILFLCQMYWLLAQCMLQNVLPHRPPLRKHSNKAEITQVPVGFDIEFIQHLGFPLVVF